MSVLRRHSHLIQRIMARLKMRCCLRQVTALVETDTLFSR